MWYNPTVLSDAGVTVPTTWDEFFAAFDENKLAFLYQDETKDGKESRFSKLIDRDSTNEKSRAARS